MNISRDKGRLFTDLALLQKSDLAKQEIAELIFLREKWEPWVRGVEVNCLKIAPEDQVKRNNHRSISSTIRRSLFSKKERFYDPFPSHTLTLPLSLALSWAGFVQVRIFSEDLPLNWNGQVLWWRHCKKINFNYDILTACHCKFLNRRAA